MKILKHFINEIIKRKNNQLIKFNNNNSIIAIIIVKYK